MIKKECLDKILKQFGDITRNENTGNNVVVAGNEGIISNCDLEDSGLFSKFDYKITDDSFYGNYKGVDFKIAETELTHRSNGGDSSPTLIFKGVIINFKFNKPIKSRTIVATKDEVISKIHFFVYLILYSIISVIICISMQVFNDFHPLYTLFAIVCFVPISIYLAELTAKHQKGSNDISLEDSNFLKKYKVYSSDQVEARYLVTPSFMERFKNLQTAFGTKGIKCSFFKNNLMVAITSFKDLFEIGSIYTPLTDFKTIEECYREIKSILDMIEYFKLNEKTNI